MSENLIKKTNNSESSSDKSESIIRLVDSKPTVYRDQQHGTTRRKSRMNHIDTSTSVSVTSLNSSISRFRDDFDQLKCKIKIFGESLNLCQCIAEDFTQKMAFMEKRLERLEKRQKIGNRSESNYSAIIQKNKFLASKTKKEALLTKFQMCGSEQEMREVAAKICRNYLNGAWKVVDPSQLQFRKVSGGLSNFLYCVELPENLEVTRAPIREASPETEEAVAASKNLLIRNSSFIMDEPKKVLLRIYGQVHGERAMDAIVTESVIFTLLSERRLGPKLYGVFSGGRIEQYIHARPLLTRELAEPAMSMKIAEKMAAIHSIDVPLSKGPNWLWKTMGKWLKTIKEERLSTAGNIKNEAEEKIFKRLKAIDWDKEIEWLKNFLSTVDSPVVFCHNDMQEGNILHLLDENETLTTIDDELSVNQYVQSFDVAAAESSKDNNHTKVNQHQQTDCQIGRFDNRIENFDDANTSDSVSSHISDSGEPKLVIIDFEYCAYNYRGFDIANHFQEWAYDYTNPEFPFYYELNEHNATLEQKEIFIKEYLKHYKSNLNDNSPPTLEEINHLLDEVDAFALASHYFWCLWSIVNASKSQIPFGYWEYALSRLESYLRLKQQVIKKDKFGLPQKRKICEVDI